MPSNLGAYFIKHNLQLEDWIGEYNQVLFCALVGGLLGASWDALRCGRAPLVDELLSFTAARALWKELPALP